tara:strand:+ start:77 stop:460 length:384 start_codon:yes stop_codon:yes gene_type:complete
MRRLRINSQFFIYLFLFCFISLINVDQIFALEVDNNKLIERISNDYTNKFCNSMAFGLSKESAMEFSIKENNQIFNNKKGFDKLDKQLLAHKIAISVDYKCSNLASFQGQHEIEEFEKQYILMSKVN